MISFFSKRSIKHKLFIIITLISGVAVLTSSAIFALNSQFSTQRALSYMVSSQSVIVSQNSAAALAFMDQQAADEILMGFSAQQHIIHVGLYDNEQKLFTELVQDFELTEPLPNVLELIKQNPSREYFELFEPVIVDNEIIGTLYVKANIKQLGTTFGSYSQIIIFVLLGSLAITWVLVSRLYRLITRPVDHVAEMARIVTRSNNYSIRAQKYHEDELGELVDGINSMLDKIQSRDELLAKQREELEARVLSRTTELEKLSEEFKFLAYHDALTNLPNRSLFIEQIDRAIELSHESGKRLAVVFLDLDGFKDINDSLGHAVGDELLIKIAERMKAVLASEHFVARFGGDEFTIILTQLASVEEADKIAESILTGIREPMKIKAHSLQISASLGMSFFPDHGSESDTLMKHADIAMYSAKESGRNTFKAYDESMQNELQLKKQD